MVGWWGRRVHPNLSLWWGTNRQFSICFKGKWFSTAFFLLLSYLYSFVLNIMIFMVCCKNVACLVKLFRIVQIKVCSPKNRTQIREFYPYRVLQKLSALRFRKKPKVFSFRRKFLDHGWKWTFFAPKVFRLPKVFDKTLKVFGNCRGLYLFATFGS